MIQRPGRAAFDAFQWAGQILGPGGIQLRLVQPLPRGSSAGVFFIASQEYIVLFLFKTNIGDRVGYRISVHSNFQTSNRVRYGTVCPPQRISIASTLVFGRTASEGICLHIPHVHRDC